jgi:hypothetical protein
MSGVIFASALALSVAAAAQGGAAEPPSGSPPPPAGEAAGPAAGGGVDEAEARRRLEAQIAKELGQDGGQGAPPATPPPPPSAPQGATGATGGNPFARLLLLPDLSAIGSFAAAYDSYDVPRLSPRSGPSAPPGKLAFRFEEVELGLQAAVDPYARADVFISFHPGGVDVEEAYLTTLSLPAGLQVRAGQFFSPFGRQNQQHPHVWEFVDAPLALDRILAADVLSGPGVEVAWLAPLPWFAELRVAGQSTQPYPAPGGEDRLTGLARLLQYFPLGAATTLGVGLSVARRDEASGGGFRDLAGADVYLRWRPAATRGYVALQGELLGRKFREVEGGRSDAGGYAQLFWRQDAYWGYGVRYDQAPVGPFFGADPAAPAGTERRYGAVASWFPSEFQRLRLQISYDRRPGGADGLEALLGLEFGIGAHGAHPF